MAQQLFACMVTLSLELYLQCTHTLVWTNLNSKVHQVCFSFLEYHFYDHMGFSLFSGGHWIHLNNRKNFFEDFAKLNGFNPLSGSSWFLHKDSIKKVLEALFSCVLYLFLSLGRSLHIKILWWVSLQSPHNFIPFRGLESIWI